MLGAFGREVAIVAIAPGTPERLRWYRDGLGLRVTLLSDPDWTTHRAYGLGRARRAQLGHPRHLWTYVRLLAKGRRPTRPRESVLGLGGDFLVDPDGLLAWAYRSANPDDWPSLAEIGAAVTSLRRDQAGGPSQSST